MDLPMFEEAAEAARSLLPEEYSDVWVRARRYGLKVWFGAAKPSRLHYEAQVIGPDGVEGARVLALEVGFHLEDVPERNDAVLAVLTSAEKRWRRMLGTEPIAGPFLGRPEDWRRVSEVWPDPDLDDPGLPFEIGARLADYVCALEPLRR